LSQIDPYIVQIPKAFQKDPEVNRWYQYTNRFLHAIWRETTGGTGTVTTPNSDLSSANLHYINYLQSRIESLSDKLEDLERRDNAGTANSKEFNGYTVTQSQTLRDFDFVNVKNRSTVTLPQYPVKNSVIIIRNGDGSTIGINANGKTLNGETVGKLYRKGTAITIQYFIDSNEWVAR
jgi:hypothetical protein